MSFDDIKLEHVTVGRDLLLLITGGEAHIGAVSTAYPAHGATEVRTSAVPGHKEHTISAQLAERASAVLNRTVTVVMGIHYDHLGKEEIAAIIRITDALMDNFLSVHPDSTI